MHCRNSDRTRVLRTCHRPRYPRWSFLYWSRHTARQKGFNSHPLFHWTEYWTVLVTCRYFGEFFSLEPAFSTTTAWWLATYAGLLILYSEWLLCQFWDNSGKALESENPIFGIWDMVNLWICLASSSWYSGHYMWDVETLPKQFGRRWMKKIPYQIMHGIY